MISRVASSSLLWRRTFSPSSIHQPWWSAVSVKSFSSTTLLQQASQKGEIEAPTTASKTTAVEHEEEGGESEEKSVIYRDDLARLLSETHELTLAKSKRILETLFQSIVENVSDNKAVRIGGFGTFTAHTTPARKGRNPKNGAVLEIPAKERIRFKPFTAFKDAVQSKEEP